MNIKQLTIKGYKSIGEIVLKQPNPATQGKENWKRNWKQNALGKTDDRQSQLLHSSRGSTPSLPKRKIFH